MASRFIPEQIRKLAIVGVAAVVGIGVLAWGVSNFLGSGGDDKPNVDPAIESRLAEMQAEVDKVNNKPNSPPPAPTAGPSTPFMPRPGSK